MRFLIISSNSFLNQESLGSNNVRNQESAKHTNAHIQIVHEYKKSIKRSLNGQSWYNLSNKINNYWIVTQNIKRIPVHTNKSTQINKWEKIDKILMQKYSK